MKKMGWALAGTMIPAGLLIFGISGNTHFESNSGKTVVFNEICADNRTIIKEQEHMGSDYIELYNGSEDPVSLDGWFLSDDEEEPEKYRITDVTINAHGYEVFYCEQRNGDDVENVLGFKISASGEKLFLTDPSGTIADSVYVPKLRVDTVYARNIDGAGDWEWQEASPGTCNENATKIPEVALDAPVFSKESGFYEEAFELSITAKKGETIYYTLDGSIPTEESFVYSEKLLIDDASDRENVIGGEKRLVMDWMDYEPGSTPTEKGTVIRAIAVDHKHRQSEVVTRTYFVGLEGYEEKNVLSIVADPEELLGEDGLFVTGKAYDQWYLEQEISGDQTYHDGWMDLYGEVNFGKRGSAFEAAANVQYFREGKELLNQTAGVKVHGNYTRMFPCKSLQLISREEYSGSRYFDAEIFDQVRSHAVLISTMPEKGYFQAFAEGRSIGVQQTIQQCPIFINGELWYVGVVQEKYDETFFEEHYNIPGEQILMIKDEEIEIGEQYAPVYEEWMYYLTTEDLTIEEKREWLYSQIDVQSFVDWLCYHLYLSNDDVHFFQNAIYWRTVGTSDGEYADGKWRWMIYDVDHAVVAKGAKISSFSELLLLRFNYLYKILKTDPEFMELFANTFQEMADTSFSVENAERILREAGLDLTYGDAFFTDRYPYAMESLREEMGE